VAALPRAPFSRPAPLSIASPAVTTTIILAGWIFLAAVFAIAIGQLIKIGNRNNGKPDEDD
jgi:hypothetical protein